MKSNVDGQKAGKALSRRSFALGTGAAAAMLAFGAAVKAVAAEPLSRPPGGCEYEEQLLAACIRCEKCLEACPMQVLKPAKLETGLLNARTPTMHFRDNWCDFCDSYNGGSPRCVEVCPTQALVLPSGASKENTILGKAYIRHDWCLGWLLKGCRVCYDVCPYEGLELDEFQRPHVVWDKCNGCGKCEMECVSMKATSIVDGATHRAVLVHSVLTTQRLLGDGEASSETGRLLGDSGTDRLLDIGEGRRGFGEGCAL